ncbi:hypothetical protein E2P81_ATG05811 [Venturia nashicola]|nr:hypothetical protein E2P81_ATG05811 [Venturia nashicola]
MPRTSFLWREILSEHLSGSSPTKTSVNPSGYPRNVDPARSSNVKFKTRKNHPRVFSSLHRTAGIKFKAATWMLSNTMGMFRESNESTMHLPDVLAGLQHDVMHCKRRYAHLINDAALEAISYCWAGQQATIPITQYLDTAMKAF